MAQPPQHQLGFGVRVELSLGGPTVIRSSGRYFPRFPRSWPPMLRAPAHRQIPKHRVVLGSGLPALPVPGEQGGAEPPLFGGGGIIGRFVEWVERF